jgi:hypothetical protein
VRNLFIFYARHTPPWQGTFVLGLLKCIETACVFELDE